MRCVCVLLFLLLSTEAEAHTAPAGWSYDVACCSGHDCAAVEDGVVVEDPRTGYVTVHGQMLSPSDPRLRQSLDDRDHVCKTPTKLNCVYRRPKGM